MLTSDSYNLVVGDPLVLLSLIICISTIAYHIWILSNDEPDEFYFYQEIGGINMLKICVIILFLVFVLVLILLLTEVT